MLGFLGKVDFGSDLVALLGGLGFFVVVVATAYVVAVYIKKMKEKSTADAPLAEENWDGIGEYKNDVPTGWFVIFLMSIVWAGWYYLAGYPLNAYSQIGEYNDEVKAHNTKFEAKYSAADTATLKAMGESVFLAQCSQCHGQTGDGMSGKAADLSKWGNEDGIMATVKNGAKGLGFPMGEMPAGLADEATAKKIATFVMAELSTAKKSADAAVVAEGKAAFAASCASCHGEDGKGMNGMAPDLTAYGTPKFVAETVLVKGKKGHIGNMPSFEKSGLLNKTQFMAVATYINAEMSNPKK
jgi:cytochrome c oxidase cbb3-type subunit III